MGNVTTYVYDADLLTWRYPEWPALSNAEKYRLLRGEQAHTETRTSNVTCTELHKWIAQAIDPEIATDDDISGLLVGNGGTTVSSSDTSLNNQVVDLDLTDSVYDASAEEVQFNFFMDSATANGKTLDELGLESRTGRFCNHAAISPTIDKTSAKTVIFEVTMTFS